MRSAPGASVSHYILTVSGPYEGMNKDLFVDEWKGMSFSVGCIRVWSAALTPTCVFRRITLSLCFTYKLGMICLTVIWGLSAKMSVTCSAQYLTHMRPFPALLCLIRGISERPPYPQRRQEETEQYSRQNVPKQWSMVDSFFSFLHEAIKLGVLSGKGWGCRRLLCTVLQVQWGSSQCQSFLRRKKVLRIQYWPLESRGPSTNLGGSLFWPSGTSVPWRRASLDSWVSSSPQWPQICLGRPCCGLESWRWARSWGKYTFLRKLQR